MSLSNAVVIAFLLILTASLFVTLLTYIYVDSVSRKKTNKLKRSSQDTKIGEIPDSNFKPEILTEAKEVRSDGVLATSSTVIGVISLEVFARRHMPSYILGVNRGGWLLSTYLAHRLNIGRNNLLRFDSDKNKIIDNFNPEDFSHLRNDVNILLVDDISRKGNSIRKAIQYVETHFPESKLSVAVLVVCGRKTDQDINYSPYWTQYRDIQLPWSSEERKKEARKIINTQGKVVRINDHTSLEIKVPNSILRIADDETKEGEGVDISIDDIEAVLSLLEKLFTIEAQKSAPA